MVGIISNNAILSTKETIAENSNLQQETSDSKKPLNALPKDIVNLSKAAEKAIDSYNEYKSRVQVSASDVNVDKENSVFDESSNQIKASSQFKAQLSVLEKKSELFEILKTL